VEGGGVDVGGGVGDVEKEEQLFCSAQAVFKPPKAIRGGIPICWPQFSDLGPLSVQHGFARNCTWSVVGQKQQKPSDNDDNDGGSDGVVNKGGASDDRSSSTSVVVLSLSHAAVKEQGLLGLWPDDALFELTCTLTLNDKAKMLTQTFEVANTGLGAFNFTAALHTYFAVSDVSNASVEGLQGVPYLDSLAGREQKVEQAQAVTFPHEVDRIYLGVPRELTVTDSNGSSASGGGVSGSGGGGGGGDGSGGGSDGSNNSSSSSSHQSGRGVLPRGVRVSTSSTFSDAVVWNPWSAKAQSMGDFGDEEYKGMVCVEVAQCKPAVALPSGATWVGTQTLTAI
jgi:glucose-6-phosphate 1-epimerase